MSEGEHVTGTGLIIGLCIGSLIMAAGYGLPFIKSELPLFPSDASIWGISVATVTVSVAVAGAIVAVISYRMNRGISRSSRFKDAVSLLAQGSPVTSIAGIAVVEQVASEDTRNYAWPAVEALNYFYLEAEPQARNIGYRAGVMPTYRSSEQPRNWPASNHVALDAVLTTARLADKFRTVPRVNGSLVDGKYLIAKAYFVDIVVTGRTVRNCWIQHGVINNVHFTNCDFRNARLDLVVGHRVVFKECHFSEAQMWFHEKSGSPIRQAGPRVVFQDCKGLETAKTFDTVHDEYLIRYRAFENSPPAD